MLPRLALALSLGAHAGVAAFAVGHGVEGLEGRTRNVDTVDTEILIAVESAPPVEGMVARPRGPAPSAAQSRPVTAHPDHRHAYPVAVDHHRHPHDASLVHAPLAVPEVESSPAEPVRFVLAGPVVAGPAGSRTSHGSVATAGAAQPQPQTFAETDVQRIGVPARLVASAPAAYPAAARAAGVEADVPVEIVVDAAGHVVDARPLAETGYGLDLAAVRAVRAYRFSPALREGRPVRVRMHWTVQFRLR